MLELFLGALDLLSFYERCAPPNEASRGAPKPISSPSPLRAPPHPVPQLVHRGRPLSPTVAAALAPGFCQLRKGLIQAVLVFGLVWFFFSLRLEALQLYSSRVSTPLGSPYARSRSFLPLPVPAGTPALPRAHPLAALPGDLPHNLLSSSADVKQNGDLSVAGAASLGTHPTPTPQPPDLPVFAMSP